MKGQAMSDTRDDHLRDALGQLAEASLEVTDYAGDLGNAVFEITTADSFIAVIATTLVEGGRPSAQDVRTLSRVLLAGDAWRLQNGREVDLGLAPRGAQLRAPCRARTRELCSGD
jgi:hypothetical protein